MGTRYISRSEIQIDEEVLVKLLVLKSTRHLLKHGGTNIRVNPCHICHLKDENPDNIDHRAINEVNDKLVNNPKQTIEPHKEDNENFSMNKENLNPGEEVTDD